MPSINNPSGKRNPALVIPSPFQLSLALAVVKTKPDGLALRGYIETLQVRLSARKDAAPYAEKSYVDGVAHWKALYERAETDKASLQGDNTKLQHELEKLKAEVKEIKFQGARPEKRKNAGDALPQAKRVLRSGTVAISQKPEENIANSDYGMLKDEAEGPLLLHHLFMAHKLLNDPKLDLESLALHLIQASTNIVTLLSESCQHLVDEALASQLGQHTRTQTIPDSISCLLTPVARSVTSMLHGLGQIAGKTSSLGGRRKFEGAVVYAYVAMFKGIADLVTLMSFGRATVEVVIATGGEGSKTEKNIAAGKDKQARTAQNQTLQQLSDASESLCNLLIATLSQLSPAQSIHQKLFEGWLCIILARAADCLNLLTFTRAKCNVPVKLNPIKGYEDDAAIDKAAASYEGIHIGKLLERGISLTPAFLSPQADVAKPGRRKTVNPATAKASTPASRTAIRALDKLSLSEMVKEKLQRTLMTCMFGKTKGEEEDDFFDCLQMPPCISVAGPHRNKAEKTEMYEDPEGWFKYKVWKLMGWEIIGKELDDWA
ncbi:hypothetical protein NA57DRAFT_71571 [Rhizodiscina lignyota]|uniref:Uncharacterized protein n=1 Tax=Rhizodiscina lignyota TaxID=1504668 RepID=A0A9P4M9A7_9PEZI|nr:hypothetical protein NA57DRAFT_71571 [Rhizodiscina lignyota]